MKAYKIFAALTILFTSITPVHSNNNNRVMRIGDDLQLLWDNEIVDTEKSTAIFELHNPKIVGTAIVHDAEWEGDGCNYHNIVFDGEKWRMYYLAWPTGYNKETKSFGGHLSGIKVGYAESTDGITWIKPNLGIREFNGSKENNIIFDTGDLKQLDNFFVFKDNNPDCPADEVYKALCGIHKKMLVVYLSADGINFRPGWTLVDGYYFDSLNTALWDPNTKQYFCYIRGLHHIENERNGDNQIRDIRVMYSKDFKKWSEPELLNFGDKEDYSLYTNAIHPYIRNSKLFVGFPSRYVERMQWTPNYNHLPDKEGREARMKGHPRYGLVTTDCIFIFTRDGKNFQRYDEAFISPGPQGRRNWAYGDCYPAVGMIPTPGLEGSDYELSIYNIYGHFSGEPATLYRYTMRMDGFASFKAPYAGAKLVTKPLIFRGSEMLINFSTSARGYLRITIRGERGDELDSIEIFGNQVDRVVDWQEDRLSQFEGKRVTIEFDMCDAHIYSFRFR